MAPKTPKTPNDYAELSMTRCDIQLDQTKQQTGIIYDSKKVIKELKTMIHKILCILGFSHLPLPDFHLLLSIFVLHSGEGREDVRPRLQQTSV